MSKPNPLPECQTCRFFHQHNATLVIGECRRYAPKPLIGGTGTGWTDWRWPEVTEDAGCGEHEEA
jgi:hypothetical protein